MKSFEKVKQELLKKGVKLEGFATWLWIQANGEKHGLPSDHNHHRRFGMFPDERRWHDVYPWLKTQVDIESFSCWLSGLRLPDRRLPMPVSRDPFSLLGRVFADLFRYFKF